MIDIEITRKGEYLMRHILACLCTWLLLIPAAHSLELPSSRVILTVTGEISKTNVGDEAHFDREMLLALPQHETVTSTPWHDGVVRFTGPLGRDLLTSVGAQQNTLRVTALNDYSAIVPVADLLEHDVILAMTLNGEPLRVRNNGPLFIIYPFDDNPQLQSEIVLQRSVWQVYRIDVLED